MRWNPPQSKPHPLASPPVPTPLDRLWRWMRRSRSQPPVYDVPRREYGLRVPTREEAYALMAEWHTGRDATDIALNVQMLYGQQFDTLGEDDFRDLAKVIQRYGDDREALGVQGVEQDKGAE